MRIIPTVILFLLISGCNIKEKSSSKSDENKPCNQITEYKVISSMDTITAVIKGKIFNTSEMQQIANVELQLKRDTINYQTLTDSLGDFEFIHISAGKYLLNTKHLDYQSIENREIIVGSGTINKMVISLCNN